MLEFGEIHSVGSGIVGVKVEGVHQRKYTLDSKTVSGARTYLRSSITMPSLVRFRLYTAKECGHRSLSNITNFVKISVFWQVFCLSMEKE